MLPFRDRAPAIKRALMHTKAYPGFFIGAKTERPKIESGIGFLWRRKQAASPPARESQGALWAPPAGFLGCSCDRPAIGFPPFSALRMASTDTIILLIVDYHAAIGGARPPCPRDVLEWMKHCYGGAGEEQKLHVASLCWCACSCVILHENLTIVR